MKKQDDVLKFIELRANFCSYDEIAKQIKVSKPTLINWSAKYKREIDKLKFIKLDGLLKAFREVEEARLEYLLKLKNKILDEIEKRDLSKVKFVDLLLAVEKIDAKIDRIKSFTCESDENMIDLIDLKKMKIEL